MAREVNRRRIDREGVRQSALPTGKTTTLILPENVKLFFPDKEDEFFIRVLPYEISLPNHPDNQPVGNLFYRRPYWFHRNLGGSGKHPVCPRHTFAKKCPACEAADVLKENWDQNKVAIKTLKPQHNVMYAIFDPRDPDTILLFDWNASKFSEMLEKEVNKGGTKFLDFAQPDGGMVIKFRVSKDSFVTDQGASKDFLTTDKLDFLPGKSAADLSDEQLARVPRLDELIKETSYEDMAMYLNGGEADDAPPAEGSAGRSPAPAKPPVKPAAAPAKVANEWDDAPEQTPTPAPAKPPPEPIPAPDGSVTCKACRGKGKSSKGNNCVPCDGNGWVMPTPAPTSAPAPAAGEWDDAPPAAAPAAPATKPRRADATPAAAPAAPAAPATKPGEWPDDWK